jgi:hypothetical protein
MVSPCFPLPPLQFFFFFAPVALPPSLSAAPHLCLSLNQVVPLDVELELELIQTQMAQKPVLWAEVHARALQASQNE